MVLLRLCKLSDHTGKLGVKCMYFLSRTERNIELWGKLHFFELDSSGSKIAVTHSDDDGGVGCDTYIIT